MNQGFYTGLSGLTAHQTAIDVTADNLASINTVGFRGYSTEFSNVFEDALAHFDNSNNLSDTVGEGAFINAISMNESQGSFINTESSSDLAIDGDGWFGVLDESGEVLYTRSGAFTIDANNNVVTRNEGMYVLGTIGNNINGSELTAVLDEVPLSTVGAQSKMQLPNNLYYPAEATSNVSIYGNLGLDNEPQSISSKIIASSEEIQELRLLFTQAETQPEEGLLWNVTATITPIDGEEVLSEAFGTVLFNGNGGLEQNTLSTIDNQGDLITIDMGEQYSGLIAQGHEKVTAASYNNGIERGDLLGYNIGADGRIEATFSNGKSSAVGNIALYHFINDQGLTRLSGTHFVESANSGEPTFFTDANGNVVLGATIRSHSLENANVAMEVGMTELIIMQRAYAANAKSVTTSDELVQKALNMDA